jgi:23S rRNA pseudouridine2604 synthase
MSFRRKVQYFLVQKLSISNKTAKEFLQLGLIKINNQIERENVEIFPETEVKFKNEVIKEGQIFTYFKFYKPAGIECTLNENIQDNLSEILPNKKLFPVGRLDKASEGLLILTDDGRIYDKILRKENSIEKEYFVKTDKDIDKVFVKKMEAGIEIMGKTTMPCKIQMLDNKTFTIVLTQGLNRQIRRMCYKLGFEVDFLKRIRIGNIYIENLAPSEFEIIQRPDFI